MNTRNFVYLRVILPVSMSIYDAPESRIRPAEWDLGGMGNTHIKNTEWDKSRFTAVGMKNNINSVFHVRTTVNLFSPPCILNGKKHGLFPWKVIF